MDPRIREHAQILVDHSTDVQSGDMVVVSAPSVAEDLVVALHEVIGDRGATPVSLAQSDRAERAYLRAADEFETPTHALALLAAADVSIRVRADENASEKGDVDPATTAAHRRATQPVQQEMVSKRWCLTQFPAAGNAQLAGMSREQYENFVWDAVIRDWDAQREFQQQLVEILNEGDEVRIRSGEETDLTMRIGGNVAVNDDGRKNLPGGEVATAPVRDSVEGEVHFDMPLNRQGREVSGVRLRFAEGRVESYSAERNEEILDGVFDTDEGARYLGELGVGMNRRIDRFTHNMLFDEKMGDTVHMAVGSAYEECVGDGNERNVSAEHVDMIVDVAEDAVVEVDGEVVQRDGTFVFEDDFE